MRPGMELSDNQVLASVEEALASARQTADGDASARSG